MFKKLLNSPVLFITLSLAAFFIFFISFFLLKSLNTLFKSKDLKVKGTYYLNKNYQSPDPLFTSIPNLEDIIIGPIITELDPFLGPKKAKVNIVIYTDFTCKYCYQTIKVAKQIQKEFPKTIRLVHKDFPNPDKTYLSYQAAIAGRCAQKQRKFWEMSELLYQNYNQLNQNLFLDLAKQLRLNLNQYKQCLNNKSVAQLIDDNIQEANALKISGIPLIYINDQEIMGEINYKELKKAVKKELNQQE